MWGLREGSRSHRGCRRPRFPILEHFQIRSTVTIHSYIKLCSTDFRFGFPYFHIWRFADYIRGQFTLFSLYFNIVLVNRNVMLAFLLFVCCGSKYVLCFIFFIFMIAILQSWLLREFSDLWSKLASNWYFVG